MLYPKHFYNKQIRKIAIAFASLFNTIDVQRYSGDSVLHQERVPIIYSNKAKFIQRIAQDLNEDNKIAIKLPRIAFEINGFAYSPERKTSSKRKLQFIDNTQNKGWSYNAVPYDLDFTMTIVSKSQGEAHQIVEQIIPFFTPDYTISVKMLDDIEQSVDIPISLVSVAPDDSYDGPFEDGRVITWTLNFVAKAYFFGPVRRSTGPSGSDNRIKAVIVNYYDFDTNTLITTDGVYDNNGTIDTIFDYDGNPNIDILNQDNTQTPSPVQSTLTINKGEVFDSNIVLLDNDDNPLDLTTSTVRAWMRSGLSSSDFVDFTVTYVDRATGSISLNLSTDTTKELNVGNSIYEIDIDRADGSTLRGASGTIKVNIT